jgi:hypothetical protein
VQPWPGSSPPSRAKVTTPALPPGGGRPFPWVFWPQDGPNLTVSRAASGTLTPAHHLSAGRPIRPGQWLSLSRHHPACPRSASCRSPRRASFAHLYPALPPSRIPCSRASIRHAIFHAAPTFGPRVTPAPSPHRSSPPIKTRHLSSRCPLPPPFPFSGFCTDEGRISLTRGRQGTFIPPRQSFIHRLRTGFSTDST